MFRRPIRSGTLKYPTFLLPSAYNIMKFTKLCVKIKQGEQVWGGLAKVYLEEGKPLPGLP